MKEQFRMQFVQVPAWQVILAAALVISLGIAFAVLAVGAFLIIAPVLIVAAGIYYLYARFRPRSGGERTNPDFLDVEYREVDPRRSDPQRIDRDDRR